MWTSHFHPIDPRTTKATVSDDSRVLSFRQVVELWQASGEFRKFFTAVITQCSFDAFFWETPPVTERTFDRSFDFVLVESASLSRLTPDPSPFKSHFASRHSEAVLTFPNLGGDAILVVPTPMADEACYTHLARFLRDAPASQVDAFWRTAGLAMQDRVSHRPTWLSTAGMGVSWLHLRLDSRPKYYRYEPYRTHV
ncbi:MAG TPA: hypothetical protein VFC26_03835 [Verrucomicrobiae bacterium]|nr:hypothetical protein [Verrucomicrobiae bacterium]